MLGDLAGEGIFFDHKLILCQDYKVKMRVTKEKIWKLGDAVA